jgi:hypothetical protein
MNQMGHGIRNPIGMDSSGLDERIDALVPGYMTMGENGMGGMGAMHMPVPKNSVPMRGAPGPHGYIDMGGMFTLLKVRQQVNGYEDPGWYQSPASDQSVPATPEELRRDGIPT